MGADYFGVRQCSLYRSLGVDRFVELRKQSLLLEALEGGGSSGIPESGSDGSMRVQMSSGENPTVDELRASLSPLKKHEVAECLACPISAGKVLGCYRFVHYPVDELFERRLFAYFLAMLGDSTEDYAVATDAAGRTLTASRLLYEVIVETVGDDTPWATRRGPAEFGGLASLETPLLAPLPDGSILNSAAVLHAAFHPIDEFPALQLFAFFYRDFFRWLESSGFQSDVSLTITEMREVAGLLATAVEQHEIDNVEVLVLA